MSPLLSRRPTTCSAASKRRSPNLLSIRRTLPGLLALLLAAVSSPSFAATLRGAIGWGFDGNVREAMERGKWQDDRFLRVHLEAVAPELQAQSYRARTRLRLLTERYTRYTTESRHQAEGRLEVAKRIGRDAAVWISGQLEGRTYPDNTHRNYGRQVAALGFGRPFHGGRLNLSWSLRGIDYRSTAYHDRTSHAMVFDYRRALSGRTDVGALAELEWSDYGRPAIKYDPQEDQAIRLGTQKDRAREARASLRYVRGWLLEFGLSWRSNRSNSFGYSTGTLALEWGLSGWLPGSVLFQFRGRSETTSYRDHGLEEVFVLREGEELEAAEDDNRLLVRLSRRLGRRLEAEGRISWFRNESLLVGEFYEKTLVTLGMVWTPVETSGI